MAEKIERSKFLTTSDELNISRAKSSSKKKTNETFWSELTNNDLLNKTVDGRAEVRDYRFK